MATTKSILSQSLADHLHLKPSAPGIDVESLIKELTLDEKVALTAGKDFWHTVPIPRLNIPSIRLSDGPNGVRGTRFFDGIPAACFPCGTALGATFDADLLSSVGNLLAQEAKAKGAHVLLGPTINIQRSPLGGRGFESYSEDPYLSGVLAGRYCEGVKQLGIIPTLKHFVCNDQEHERMAVNSVVTERALREIYLLPFMIAIRMAQPAAIMTAYNKVNGVHASESQRLLADILRSEWKWKGLVMSDWFGTYSTSEAINAGLDLEMPGPTRFRGQALSQAVTSNKVKMTKLNERVRAVLDFVRLGMKSGVPENAPESKLDRPSDRKQLRQIGAQSIVLLKNDDSVLPLKKDKQIAVIGPNSKIASISGGGSASLNPYYTVSPYEGIKAQAAAEIKFAQGVYSHQFLPALGKFLRTASDTIGFTLRVYNESPDFKERKPLEERTLTDSNMFFIDYSHPDLVPTWYADAEGIFTPEESGLYDFGIAVSGTARLYIDGELIVSNVENQRHGTSFLGVGTVEETGSKQLVAGQQYEVVAQWGHPNTSNLKVPGVVDFGHGGLRLGGCKRLNTKDSIQEATELARTVDQVVLFAGLSGEWETEGNDRDTMDLPPHTDELISRVLEANPNTVVVIQSGTPVTMPWADKAKAIVHAWYGGNEGGNAIADIIYGDVNPSAKLPLTIPRRVQDNPAYLNYRSEAGRTLYGEDIYVGYRYYEKIELAPLFPFGHGLSYTTFRLSDLKLGYVSNNTAQVSLKVANTGRMAGAEVVQLYVVPIRPRVNRPVKELKGFQKVLLGPGEEKTVEVDVDFVRATSFWDEHSDSWCSDAGTYKILVGNSSNGEFLESSLQIERTTYWSGI